ncbi:NtaA/DmoA family FMN-dependent monooxygenase [Microbacteriaceae bacterium VKM Ac-2854]|nr:NtaA/DmoA family FMN-dependent monooxygenase [Microbacteriaceae bacterium VKM Ac-2854]
MTTPRQIHLGLWLTPIAGLGGWRAPDSGVENVNDLEPYVELAELAERGRLDAVIRGDGVNVHKDRAKDGPFGPLELITLLAALAARTEKVGLIGTASSTFSDPYNLARQFASLDHISRGRVGWNLVTSSAGERNFGYDEIPDQVARYARADEFLQVATKLWDSWAPDAIAIDRENGRYSHPERVREIHHSGEHFRVDGALNVSRSPQGRPVLVQAGSSGPGRDFAARNAEVIFTAATSSDKAADFYRDIKRRIGDAGRDPSSVSVLPGFNLFVAETESEAKKLYRDRLDDFDFEKAIPALAETLGGADFTDIGLDERIPAERFVDTSTLSRRQSRPQIFVDLALERGYTLRQVLEVYLTSFGHNHFVGSAEQAADELQRWFTEGAADGFVIFPGRGLESARLLVDVVVPILRSRGLFREEYEGTTLRDHFGLPPVEPVLPVDLRGEVLYA